MKKLAPVKPKRPTSSFFYFTIENRKKITAANPGIAFKDIAAFNAKDWKAISEGDKKKFEKMVDEDRKRYAKEMKQFNELGYFVN